MRKYEKERLERISDFGGSCQCCGYNKCSRALHFHHVDPSTKKEWPGNGGRAELKEIQAYPERFVLLCANCHIEEHDKQSRANYTLVRCAYCQKEFRIKPYRKLDRTRGKYCSRACQQKLRLAQAPTKEHIAQRLWSHIRKTDTCWEWTGYVMKGVTPMMVVTDITGCHTYRSVPRFVYELEHGPLSPHEQVIRACENPCCVRPHPDHVVRKRDRTKRVDYKTDKEGAT